MSRLEREGAGVQDAEHRLLLLMEPGRDRDLLGEWLGSIPRYGVLARDPEGPLPEVGGYDLCILDRAALERREVDLRDREREADPLFLPCLLVVPEDADGTYGTGEGSVVDDVVTLPAEKGILHQRIENLLEARRAFLRLRERERQYEELVDLAPEAILVLRDREIVYSNSAALEVFGALEPGDLHGRAITSLAGEAGREELAALVEEIDGEGRVGEFRELVMESVDGEEVRAEAAGVRITFGEEPAIQLVIRDVTGEYERKQRLDLFGRAIQTAIQGVTIADASQPDEPLIYANNAFEEITGYSAAEVMGRNCRFLQGERTDEAKVRRLREGIDAGEPASVELLNYRKNGTPFWNRVEIVPITDEEGGVTHFLGLQRDVTQRKGREERLQVLSRVLRHNLRNSMNVITGYAEELRDGEGDPSEAGERILGAATSLLSISEQIDEFRSVVSAEDQETEAHDLAAVLERLAVGFREEHPEATLRLDLPEAAVVRSHGLLPAALGELLALSTADGASAPELDIAVRSDGDWVTVELTDRARMIPESDLRAIGVASETPLEHAEGLELWLVRWAVAYSDGELRVLEDGDRRIRIRLPRAGA